MIIELFDKKWEVNPITRKNRRHLHRLRESMIISGSTFKIKESKNGEAPEVEVDKFNLDGEIYGKLLDETLDFAFGKEKADLLDDELDDSNQDILAQIILNSYLTIEKKKITS